MSEKTKLALMAGVFLGGVYGGSRTAIMINIPGAPAAIAAGFDGYLSKPVDTRRLPEVVEQFIHAGRKAAHA